MRAGLRLWAGFPAEVGYRLDQETGRSQDRELGGGRGTRALAWRVECQLEGRVESGEPAKASGP